MAGVADKVTRLSADLVASAIAEGARESRSGRQQLEHWARVGREVSNQRKVARQRVEAALAGRLPLRALSSEEGVVFNAEVAAALEESLSTGNHVADRAARGLSSVVLDAQGRVVKHNPDGTVTVLSS